MFWLFHLICHWVVIPGIDLWCISQSKFNVKLNSSGLYWVHAYASQDLILHCQYKAVRAWPNTSVCEFQMHNSYVVPHQEQVMHLPALVFVLGVQGLDHLPLPLFNAIEFIK
jgi:hypothetical protein